MKYPKDKSNVITGEILRKMIEDILNDTSFPGPSTLPMEPVGTEDPPELLEQKKSKIQIASQLINTMTPEEKNQLFAFYKRWPWETLLARFSEMKQAEKGAK